MRPAAAAGLLAFAAMSFVAEARAQGFYWSLAYEPSVPIGGIRNASTYPSAAGASLSARYLFTKHWSLGLGGHFNQFGRNYPSATYPIDNGANTGAVYRRVWVAALVAEAYVYLKPDEPVSPYAGVGAGVAWMSNLAQVSDFTFEALARGLALCPEAGIHIAFDRDPFDPQHGPLQSAVIGLRYTYSTADSRDVTNTSFLALTLGILAY